MIMIIELDEKTINKIAAGEVIERPASVVKELVENSIDAGADDIRIKIWGGGADKIIIQDNGSGMCVEDAKKCILRHATSKIKSYDDLFRVSTMGFRGEALSSVAAVSRMRILTKKDKGVELTIEAGKIIRTDAAAVNKGTKMVIKDLFYNVPARKKFLKSRNYEQKLVTDIVMRYGLIHTEISFTLHADDRLLIEKPKTKSIRENIAAIYGIEAARESFDVDWGYVTGVIVKPTINRATRDYMSVFINKRSVRSKVVEDAVMDAMRTLMFHDRYPIFVLDLEIDPLMLDVNVHPAKRIVKFEKENEVYKTVFDAVKDAISKADLYTTKTPVPEDGSSQALLDRSESAAGFQGAASSPERKNYFSPGRDRQEILSDKSNSYSGRGNSFHDPDSSAYGNVVQRGAEDVSQDAKADASGQAADKPDVNILGQVHKTYIIVETSSGYGIIDQHAAHERIMYERYRSQLGSGNLESQELLAGYDFDVDASQRALILEHKDELCRLGFDIEEFGPASMSARKIPAGLDISESDLGNTIIDIALKLEKGVKTQDDTMLKYMACRSAIKGGDELNHIQMKKLVEELFSTDNRYTCPHGRPVMLRYDLKQIEKDFLRSS